MPKASNPTPRQTPRNRGIQYQHYVYTSGAFSHHCFIVCSSSSLGRGYLHHVTRRRERSMGPIFIGRDLNIEHQEIHRKPLPQKNRIISPEILHWEYLEARGLRHVLPLRTSLRRTERSSAIIGLARETSTGSSERIPTIRGTTSGGLSPTATRVDITKRLATSRPMTYTTGDERPHWCAAETLKSETLMFIFGSAAANIFMIIGVALLGLTLYFGVNPAECLCRRSFSERNLDSYIPFCHHNARSDGPVGRRRWYCWSRTNVFHTDLCVLDIG